MSDHPVLGAHGEAVEVPFAAHILPRDGISEALGGTQVLNEARHLRDGSDVADKDAAGDECVRDRLDVLPGSQHVQHDAINAAFLGRPQHLVNVADTQIPRGMTTAKP